jgi:rod shape-determining protein MreC
MSLFARHKNSLALALVLLIQLLALGVQVKQQNAEGPVRAIRRISVNTISTFERALLHTGSGIRGVWTNYFDLRHVRRENLRLKEETDRMRLERAREKEEVRQAQRLYALLAFKQQWIDTTVAAQVIGTSGMETSRLLYLDKGASDGIRPDMPVITPDGVVGKVLAVFGDTSQVLMINDPSSGVGALMVNSRLQGVVKGTPTGGVMLDHIMVGETVQPGEPLVTSGGDRIFPKGVPIGSVLKAGTGHNLMLDIQVKPAANLNRLEEVLVITHQKAREPDTTGLGAIRASDILSEHLPSVPTPAPEAAPGTAAPAGAAPAAGGMSPGGTAPKPAAPGTATAAPKPAAQRATTAAPKPAQPGTTAAPKPAVPVATATPKPASPSAATAPKAPKSAAAASNAGSNAGQSANRAKPTATAEPANAAEEETHGR